MNINKWLFPRPFVNWNLSKYQGEIIWIPVRSNRVNKSKHSAYYHSEQDYLSTNTVDNMTHSSVTRSNVSNEYEHVMNRASKIPTMRQAQAKGRMTIPVPDTTEGQLFQPPPELVKTYLEAIQGDQESPRPPSEATELDLSMIWMEDKALYSSRQDNNVLYKIPCLFTNYGRYSSDKLLIYFHSNAEDIHSSRAWCEAISENLCVTVLAVEYPGYSYYVDNESSEELICKDAVHVFNFLVNELGFLPEDLWVMGRSIGCTPAMHLASSKPIGRLFLVSPFLSVKSILKDHYGFLGSIGYFFIEDCFDNEGRISKIRCPTVLIHGKKDNLIYHTQSMSIFELLNSKAEIFLPDEMTHTRIDPVNHICMPINIFNEKLDKAQHKTFSKHQQHYTMPLPSPRGVPLKFFDYDTAS